MDAPALVARGICRDFGGRPVLRGVDLSVAPGDVVALLGANGAGKTTLLRVLALVLTPSAGTVTVCGHDATTGRAQAQRALGYLGHESACYPDLSARENLAFYARLYELPDAAARVEELLAWTELAEAAHRPLRVYSRGMTQRVALARAILHRPGVLLLDEPFTGLDPAGAAALASRLAALAADGTAVVLSVHDVERAAAVATRGVILHRGRIAWSGTELAGGDGVLRAYRSVVGMRS